jgi:hypothetical protein
MLPNKSQTLSGACAGKGKIIAANGEGHIVIFLYNMQAADLS